MATVRADELVARGEAPLTTTEGEQAQGTQQEKGRVPAYDASPLNEPLLGTVG